MISHFVAARHTAFGGGVCHFVSAAAWKGAVTGASLESIASAQSELVQADATASAKPAAEGRPSVESSSVSHKFHEASACNCNISPAITSSLPATTCSRLRHRPSFITGALAGLTAWRLLPAAAAASESATEAVVTSASGPLRRCLHSSPPATGAAAVSAAAAAAAAVAAEAAAAADRQAAAAAAAAAAATTRTRPPPAARRQQPLSPHAYEFQRRFFQLVNSGSTAAMAASSVDVGRNSSSSSNSGASAAEAVAHTTNSQAIRMLMAWLEEGRITAAAEYREQHQHATGGAAAAIAVAPPPPPPGAVATPYRLDQQIIDRAMEVVWRLYHREELQREVSGLMSRARSRDTATTDPAAASSTPGSSGSSAGVAGGGGPMGLSELLNAAEVMAAAAPAMGLTFKRQHYELLIELYGKRALLEPPFRRGLAQRLLAVRQQMVQQLMPLNQMCLNTMLQAVRTDPLINAHTKLTWAVRLVERDLPVAAGEAAAAAAVSASPPSTISSSSSASRTSQRSNTVASLMPPLQQTLGFMLRMAAREADWSAYGKLEASLVCRTRAPPPYEVLLEALHAASAAASSTSSSNSSSGLSASRLALGFLAQIEQLEARGQQQQRRQAGVRQQQPSGPQQQRWQELAAERRLDQELRSLRQLVHVGVEQGDEQLARKSYDRLRSLFWREHPAVAAAVAAAAKASKLNKADKASTTEDPATAAATAGAETEEKQKGDGGDLAGIEGGEAGREEAEEEAAEAAAVLATTTVVAAANPSAAYGPAAVLEAAEKCLAPPGATLELLSLSLSRRDWSGVLDHVTALAELQSLVTRSGGRVGRLLMEDVRLLEGLTSAYGGLGPVSRALIGSEEDTVSYYTELLQRIGDAAAAGDAAPFGGSSVPFGPPLRAAAARADMASVSAIVRQMRELHCGPGADSYAAVVEASLRGGKPDRVPGLLDMMLEEGLVPTGPFWEVQLREAIDSGDLGGLLAISERALDLVEENWRAGPGLADINIEVLAAAAALAEVRVDSRAASVIKLLKLRSEELRNRRRSAVGAALPQTPGFRQAGSVLRRNAALLLQPPKQWRRTPRGEADP